MDRPDAFHPSVVPGVSLIVQMRLYDVLMGLYHQIDPDGAVKMNNLHSQGKILFSLPYLDMETEEQ